jgi:hypothetical protein
MESMTKMKQEHASITELIGLESVTRLRFKSTHTLPANNTEYMPVGNIVSALDYESESSSPTIEKQLEHDGYEVKEENIGHVGLQPGLLGSAGEGKS